MLPRTMIIVTSLLLAGSLHLVGAASTGCGDSSYQKNAPTGTPTYAPAPSPVFQAPAKGHYYYFGLPTASADGSVSGVTGSDGMPVLPLSEWIESNRLPGLQVGNCVSGGVFQAPSDDRAGNLLA